MAWINFHSNVVNWSCSPLLILLIRLGHLSKLSFPSWFKSALVLLYMRRYLWVVVEVSVWEIHPMIRVDISLIGTKHFVEWGPWKSTEVPSRKMVLLSERSEVIAEKLALYIFNHSERIAMNSVPVLKVWLKVLLLSRWVFRLLVIRFLFIKVEVIESTHC
jgi:hypothetical protein